jgi:hypothetical protein
MFRWEGGYFVFWMGEWTRIKHTLLPDPTIPNAQFIISSRTGWVLTLGKDQFSTQSKVDGDI